MKFRHLKLISFYGILIVRKSTMPSHYYALTTSASELHCQHQLPTHAHTCRKSKRAQWKHCQYKCIHLRTMQRVLIQTGSRLIMPHTYMIHRRVYVLYIARGGAAQWWPSTILSLSLRPIEMNVLWYFVIVVQLLWPKPAPIATATTTHLFVQRCTGRNETRCCVTPFQHVASVNCLLLCGIPWNPPRNLTFCHVSLKTIADHGCKRYFCYCYDTHTHTDKRTDTHTHTCVYSLSNCPHSLGSWAALLVIASLCVWLRKVSLLDCMYSRTHMSYEHVAKRTRSHVRNVYFNW